MNTFPNAGIILSSDIFKPTREPGFRNRESLFDIRSINTWILALSVGADLLWSFFALRTAFSITYSLKVDIGQVQIVLWIGEFIGPFIIGWHCGWVALDDRGASCGLIGVLGSVLMIMTTLLASGWTVSLLSIVALTGGFNGGVMTRYRGKSE